MILKLVIYYSYGHQKNFFTYFLNPDAFFGVPAALEEFEMDLSLSPTWLKWLLPVLNRSGEFFRPAALPWEFFRTGLLEPWEIFRTGFEFWLEFFTLRELSPCEWLGRERFLLASMAVVKISPGGECWGLCNTKVRGSNAFRVEMSGHQEIWKRKSTFF